MKHVNSNPVYKLNKKCVVCGKRAVSVFQTRFLCLECGKEPLKALQGGKNEPSN